MHNAIVIGAGSIGALKPDKFDSPETSEILTHAHMYYANQEIELVGIYDNDFTKVIKAGRKWNTHGGPSPDGIFTDSDIISVCTPTKTHKEVLLEVLQYNPKLVIAEKPFCNNYKEAFEVAEAYENRNIPIFVNYSRRFLPAYQALRLSIINELYGKIQSATFHYTRGLKHEGCHAINLCLFLFGKFQGGELMQPNHYRIPDRDPDDPTLAAYLSFERCPHVFLSPCDGRQYKVFQLEIMTEKGKIILSHHGLFIEFYDAIKDNIWGDFNVLSKDVNLNKTIRTDLDKSFVYLGIEILNMLYNPYYSDSVHDALMTHQILEGLNFKWREKI